ncbi:MAG: hypothetical protein V2J02_21865, partial [Pseudomonadales bacterium]|nr:hypothetical protein [Pseudomonadales bacterium]
MVADVWAFESFLDELQHSYHQPLYVPVFGSDTFGDVVDLFQHGMEHGPGQARTAQRVRELRAMLSASSDPDEVQITALTPLDQALPPPGRRQTWESLMKLYPGLPALCVPPRCWMLTPLAFLLTLPIALTAGIALTFILSA